MLQSYAFAGPVLPPLVPVAEVAQDSRPWIMNMSGEAAMRWNGDGQACISIRGSRDMTCKLNGFKDVLLLQFDDIDPARMRDLRTDQYKYFSVADAIDIKTFVDRHRGLNMVVHCAAGISRSGAVVEALLQYMPEYEDRGWARYPNTHVLITLKRVLHLTPLGYVN